MSKEAILKNLNEIQELVNDDKKFKYKSIVNFNCEHIKEELEVIEKGKNTDIIDNYMAFKNGNANPSEALKALKELRVIANTYCSFNDTQCEHNKELTDIIEKALLKTQEPKKYLKWEDLIFSKDPTYIKATLNSISVTIKCWKEYMKEWCSVDFNNAPCNNMMFVHHGYDDDTDTQSNLFDALGFVRI